MPIDLATHPGPLRVSDPTIGDDLKDLQGNILSGHGRDYATYLFLRFKDGGRARAVLSGLAQASVTSAFQQLGDSKNFKDTGVDAGLFVHVALSATGYEFLQIDQVPRGSNPRGRLAEDGYLDVFAAGMKNRRTELDDPPLSEWEEPYRHDIHALMLLAADNASALEQAGKKVRASFAADSPAPIATISEPESGFMQRRKFAGDPTKDGQPVEHFGFMDAISQPALLDNQIKEEKQGWDPVAPPRLVLVKDPNGKGFGSFLVFRKLEQNVRGFWMGVRELSKRLDGPPAVVAAMAIGRFMNGTPVVLAGRAGEGVSRANGFNYDADPKGYRCPFHAHTRKTNPRLESTQVGDITAEEERGHRIARRGIPYPAVERDDFDVEPAELPAGGVGLLFACYQGDIWEQFEFQQRFWCNDPKFLHPNTDAGWGGGGAYALGTGVDAIVGQHLRESTRTAASGWRPGNWPRAWGVRPVRTGSISGYVAMRGGEYFFAPSLSGLRSLDDGAPPVDIR